MDFLQMALLRMLVNQSRQGALSPLSDLMSEQDDINKIKKILNENTHLNFVQRILNPENYPIMLMPEYGKGGFGTHLMSYSTTPKGAMIYPQIIQDPKTGRLIRLAPDVASRYAYDTGQYFMLPTEDAEWFGKNYKKVWDKNTWDRFRARVEKGDTQHE